MAASHSPSGRPTTFIGAAAENRPIAEALQKQLRAVADVTVWFDDEAVPVSMAFDTAAFILRGERESAVLFRLGVFVGALGPERVLVCPVSSTVELPPELRAVTIANDLATIEKHVRRLPEATAAHSTPTVSAPDSRDHVARRLRRSLGSATSGRPGQSLRIADISLSGALLETFGEIPENQVLDLELALENGRRIRVAAKVVRIQYPQWGRVGGVGVQFVRFEGASRAILERYLEADTASAT